MWKEMETGASGGDNTVKVFRGLPSSATITCGFQPSKVYLSDSTYNSSHKLIRVYDASIEANKYLQGYDGGATWQNGATGFVTISSNGFTISGDIFSLLSANCVIMAYE